ncbi:hypothetical protein HYN48_14825 [Flavobacterium magnum]|uniref:Uncharacterized protein n=1 Tax=Flavobacterium magnum TaxID=2162713 RepID=A0A2S0RHV4_9FLAO|nr:hypothetical protein [Flavobacterium magnum]AWA31264.1 hypothetical protein HYN48_14825 [Flavobacterium magnum]
MDRDYTTIHNGIATLLLVSGIVFVPSALLATIPATVGLWVIGKVLTKYEVRMHDAFIAAFWAAFTYLAVSMLMSIVLYFRAVHLQDYKLSFYPSWLLNYYTPRHVPIYYKIMLALHSVCILASAFVLSRKLKSRTRQRIPYLYSVLWVMAVLLPCLLFGLYCVVIAMNLFFPVQMQSIINYALIK